MFLRAFMRSFMGGVISLFQRPRRVLILGPKEAGKSSVFEQFAYVSKSKPKPSAHRHFGFMKMKNHYVWDLPAENPNAPFWAYYFGGTACIVYVYDAQKPEESERLLQELCYTRELKHAAILVMINKIKEEANEFEQISQILKRRQHFIMKIPYNQRPMEIKPGIEWLVKNV